jgi:sensor domain CHASE-containing protein
MVIHKITMDQIYQKDPDFIARPLDNEMILVPIKKSSADLERFFVLNETGKVIWDQIDGKKSLLEIRQSLEEQFEVKPAQAEQDLNNFIKDLIEVEGVTEKKATD